MPIFADIERVGPSGEYDFQSGTDPAGMDRSYTLEFFIHLYNSAPWSSVEPRQWLLDSRLPQYLDSYSIYDPAALLRNGTIRRSKGNRLELLVNYTWSPAPLGQFVPWNQVLPGSASPTGGPSGGSGNPQNDPTQFAPRWQYTYETVEVPMVTDVAGTRVVNKAGDRFEPLPTRPLQIRVLTYTRYEEGWQESTWDTYGFKTNLTPWRGNIAESVLLFPPTVGDYVVVGGILFYPVTYVFKMKMESPRSWDLTLDNFGFRQLVAGKTIDIVVRGGKVQKPWPLRSTGAMVPETAISTETPAQSTFIKFDKIEFADINIAMPPIV